MNKANRETLRYSILHSFSSFFLFFLKRVYVGMYIYIYVCVCVCVCVYIYISCVLCLPINIFYLHHKEKRWWINVNRLGISIRCAILYVYLIVSMIVLNNTICAILYVFLLYIYIYIYMQVCICMYVCVFVCIYICVCVCIYIYMYV